MDSDHNPPRILIIDDNPAILRDFEITLIRAPEPNHLLQHESALFGAVEATTTPEYRLDFARQGQTGYELVRAATEAGDPYSVVFVDMRMPPGWDGLETVKRLWQVDEDLEVVICSACGEYSWKETLRKLGQTDRFLIIKKPFDTAEICQVALALTRKAELRRQAKLKLGDLNELVHERTRELERALATIKKANDALAEAKKSADQANRTKSLFLANMSHEIRTPMSGVLGLTELLLATPLNEDQHEMLTTMGRAGESLLAILNDILDVSKIEAGNMEIKRVPANVEAIVDSVVALLAFRASAKGIELSSSVALPEADLLIDPVRMRQLLLNLVGNSIKFTNDGKVEVRVETECTSSLELQLMVRVVDTGVGIAREHQTRIFESFTQADESTERRFGGTGLGLAICHQLVELMGGELKLESELGRGSTFWFRIPATRVEAPLSGDGSSTLEDPELGARVLLVEDNRIAQLVGRKQLLRLGCTVDLAEDGSRAVQMFQAGSYDLVLMDCHMPRMNGLGATRMIRAIEAKLAKAADGTPRSGEPTAEEAGAIRVPIVGLTASTLARDHQQCLAAGMDAVAVKPANVDVIRRIVKEHVRGEGHPKSWAWAQRGTAMGPRRSSGGRG